ncbi:serine hydrolase [Nakamurella sp. PAMC28650]|nr:serine hydrolase [Nakamurella sp. PAMC28650]
MGLAACTSKATTGSSAAGSTPADVSAAATSPVAKSDALLSTALAPVVPTQPMLSPSQVSGVPIPAGRIDASIKQLDALAAKLMARSGVPGMAVAVVHGGKTVYAKGFGVKEIGQSGQVDANTVFQLASLSKPIGATVVARQVSKKRITWETKVVEHLPWFALADPYVTANLTIGDCYAHRSGLSGQSGDLIEDLGYDRKQVLTRLRYLPLDPFRITYNYTNWGITAGAEAAAVASGIEWEALSERDLYAPLGMTSTSSRFADYKARKNRAVGHAYVDGRFQAKYVREPDTQAPAGGVSSSVDDLGKWLALLLADGKAPAAGTDADGQFITPQALGAALTPQIVSSPPATPDARTGFYGFGFNVGVQPSGRVQFSHSGAFILGAGTNVVLLPSADIAIVTLTNAAPMGLAESLNAEFMDLVQFGSSQRDWYAGYHALLAALLVPVGALVGKVPPAAPVPAKASTRYIGRYTHDCYGPVEVVASGAALALLLGPQPVSYPMTHWSGDEFIVHFNFESTGIGSVSAVTFKLGASGPATSVLIEVLDKDKVGNFTRAGA